MTAIKLAFLSPERRPHQSICFRPVAIISMAAKLKSKLETRIQISVVQKYIYTIWSLGFFHRCLVMWETVALSLKAIKGEFATKCLDHWRCRHWNKLPIYKAETRKEFLVNCDMEFSSGPGVHCDVENKERDRASDRDRDQARDRNREFVLRNKCAFNAVSSVSVCSVTKLGEQLFSSGTGYDKLHIRHVAGNHLCREDFRRSH